MEGKICVIHMISMLSESQIQFITMKIKILCTAEWSTKKYPNLQKQSVMAEENKWLHSPEKCVSRLKTCT